MSTVVPDFESFHDRLRPRVLRYMMHFVGEAEAEDLTQTVMLKVSRGLSGFRGDSSLSTWIYRIAKNTATDRLRHKTTQPLNEAELEPDEGNAPSGPQTPSVEAAAIREEMSTCIREFIERLPENYRTVMVLSELQGFKNDEIAATLDVSVDTVKIRLHRARKKLRRDLEAGCSFHRDEDGELACDRNPTAPGTPCRRG